MIDQGRSGRSRVRKPEPHNPNTRKTKGPRLTGKPEPAPEREDRFREFLEKLGDAAYEADAEGIVTYANPAASALTGLPLQELLGHSFLRLFPEKSRATAREAHRKTLRGERVEDELTLANGRVLHFKNEPFTDREGKVVGVFGIARDVTERKRQEQELKESREIVHLIADGLPMLVAYVDSDQRHRFVNREYENWFQVPPSEIQGKTIREFLGGAIYAGIRDKVEAALRGEPVTYEGALPRKEGGLRLFRARYVPHRADTGEVLGFFVMVEDITESHRREKQIRDGERFLSNIFSSIQDGISILDRNLNILRVNRTMERWYAHAVPLAGKRCHEAYHRRNDPCEVCPSQKTIRNGKASKEIVPKRGPGGETAGWLELYSFPLFDETTGELEGVIEYVRDVTERKAAEDRSRESQERYVRAEKIGRMGHWDGDFQAGRSVWSEELYRIFGVNPDQVEPVYREFLKLVHPEDREAVKQKVRNALSRGEPLEQEYRIVRPDGKVRFIHSLSEFHADEAGRPLKSFGTLMDITDRKQMEMQIAKAQQLESLGILAGGIAHDFNNILTPILANISIARTYGDLREEIAELLTDAEKASLRAKSLTQQLLTFSKGGAPVKRVTSVAGLLRDETRFGLSGSNVRSVFSIDEDLWPVEVDEGQIGQVIHNMVINADQAMPEGGTLTVRAANVSVGPGNPLSLKEGRYICVSIIDQGVGIPGNHLPKIFDPFYSTKERGSGLGLSTSYAIVHRHGGSIRVESETGSGTAFHVYLPATDQDAAQAERASGEPPRGHGRILLVDDEETVRKSGGEILKRLGYEVEFAAEGAEAVRAYDRAQREDRPFDLVIMDLTIPGGMGGADAAERIREIHPQSRVILSSGYSEDRALAHHREHGFCGVLAKPYNVEALAREVHRAMTRPAGDEGGESPEGSRSGEG
jgi:two-component system, cell cycle sensor histidine kinase and response regulator CckA